ncbi:hypothetical protein DIZ76_010068 [Coccidioides immitis]|nr:hypothetical protein DIZ76_010068 [Coccidioides immitis]
MAAQRPLGPKLSDSSSFGIPPAGPPPPPSNPPKPAKGPSTRRALSCLPCRRHKLKCDRQVPCHSCTRYRREDLCRKHPAPSSLLEGVRGGPKAPTNAIAAVSDASSSSPSSSAQDATPYSNPTSKPGTASVVRPETTINPPPSTTIRDAGTTASLPLGNTLSLRTSTSQNSDVVLRVAGTSTAPRTLPILLSAVQGLNSQAEVASFWKSELTASLPSKYQCDLLTMYYLEHINWVFHFLHSPSFQDEYAAFWNTKVQDINLIWLSFLYSIISCSAIFLPLDAAQNAGFPGRSLRNKSHEWYSASRQALHAGGFEARPTVTQLLTFLITQLYCHLGQAVRNAQALGLDRDVPGKNYIDTELRRRIWWELFNCDIFQSMCLGRAPLISTSPSKVPFPAHCNDDDITETSIKPRPMEEPTDTTANILRAEAFMIFEKLYNTDVDLLSSYEYVKSVDDEIADLVSKFPWYFQIGPNRECAILGDHLEFITWQHHMINSCICMQRIRMNRPFIHTRTGNSWEVCVKAANDVLAVYSNLRNRNVDEFRKSQKFLIQGYQTFSAAVSLAGFLLVERAFPADNIRKDIEMIIADLAYTDANISIAVDGRKVLIKMLEMHDRRGLREPLDPETVISEIATVFGGEQSTRKYLKRCDIGYVLNDEPATTGPTAAAVPVSTTRPVDQTVSDHAIAATHPQASMAHMISMGTLPEYRDPYYNMPETIQFTFDDNYMNWDVMLQHMSYYQQ